MERFTVKAHLKTENRYLEAVKNIIGPGSTVENADLPNLSRVIYQALTAIPGIEMESVEVYSCGEVSKPNDPWQRLVDGIKELGLYNEEESSEDVIKIGGMEDQIFLRTYSELKDLLVDEWGIPSILEHIHDDGRLWVVYCRWQKESVMSAEDGEAIDEMVKNYVAEEYCHLITELADGPLNVDNVLNLEYCGNDLYEEKGGWY